LALSKDRLLLYARYPERFRPLRQVLSASFSVVTITEVRELETVAAMPMQAAVVDSSAYRSFGREIIRALRGREGGADTAILEIVDPTDPPEAAPAGAEPDRQVSSRASLGDWISAFWSGHAKRDELAWAGLDDDSRAILTSAKQAFDCLHGLANGEGDQEELRGFFRDAAHELASLSEVKRSSAVLEALRSHHDYTFAHSGKVGLLLTGFGAAIGLGFEERKLLAEAGLLHDVGKLRVPLSILAKPGPLTGSEFAVMRDHARLGDEMLAEIYPDLPEIRIAARQHHEKLDGSGYPDGLRMGQIHEVGLLTAVVDIFAALTDRRDYKSALSTDAALKVMTPMAGPLIEPKLFHRFQQYVLAVPEPAIPRPDDGGGAVVAPGTDRCRNGGAPGYQAAAGPI